MKRVPFLDVKAGFLELRDELDEAYNRVMFSGRYILGDEVERFEEEFATYCGTKYCVGVGNGLDALHLVLKALEVGPGCEVIVPAQTFIATWLAVVYCGATPIAVDVDRGTGNLDPELLAAAITHRTRVVVAVHLFGQPADVVRLVNAARGVPIVEDAAQAHGARYRGAVCGGLGVAAAFSFYPGKNLGAFGDGGAVTTNDATMADHVRLLRSYGSASKYEHMVAGVNSRLDSLQAAFLRVKLRHLERWNAARRRIAANYQSALVKVPGVQMLGSVQGAESCFHLFPVRSAKRDQLSRYLSDCGIETLVHYPVPPHLSPVFSGSQAGRRYPAAEELASSLLSLPIGPHMSEADQQAVIEAVRRFAP